LSILTRPDDSPDDSPLDAGGFIQLRRIRLGSLNYLQCHGNATGRGKQITQNMYNRKDG